MTISALQLGSELIRRSAARGKPITNLTLQKLAYFAHGWGLALLEEPLVNDDFEAWRYGPVLPSLYHAFKGFSSNPIPPDHPLLEEQGARGMSKLEGELIDKVLEVYGNHGSFDLVDISHDPRGPWYAAYHDVQASGIISNESIGAYFRSLRAQ